MSDYTKFKEIYDEIDCLIRKRVSSSTPEFQAWKVKTERFLIKKYGEKSYELKNFKGYAFSLMVYTFDTTDEEFVAACAEDLRAIKAIFALLQKIRRNNLHFNLCHCRISQEVVAICNATLQKFLYILLHIFLKLY